LSVSRVGGAAQISAMKKLAGPLRLELAQFRELEAFAQFGSDLTKDTLERLNQGRRIVEILKQPQNAPLPVEHQVLLFFAITRRLFSDVDVEEIQDIERGLLKYFDENCEDILTKIRTLRKIDGLETTIEDGIAKFKVSRE